MYEAIIINVKCDYGMVRFKGGSCILEIDMEIFADKMRKHFTKSYVHYDPIFIRKLYIEYRH